MLRSGPLSLLGVLLAGATLVAAQNNSSNTSRSSAVAGVLLGKPTCNVWVPRYNPHALLMRCKASCEPARHDTPHHTKPLHKLKLREQWRTHVSSRARGTPAYAAGQRVSAPGSGRLCAAAVCERGRGCTRAVCTTAGPSAWHRCGVFTASRASAARTYLLQLGGFQWWISAPTCVLAFQALSTHDINYFTTDSKKLYHVLARSVSPSSI
ncbi:hypothetical protein DFH06DRAFT_1194004 [Mycena polygramma]|nr:hypothetical protein DFH06DRAFT_1194004 [Mycena polygramma]